MRKLTASLISRAPRAARDSQPASARSSRVTAILFAITGLISTYAEVGSALPNDPALHGLCGADCQTSGLPMLGPTEIASFEGMTRAYGLALAPLSLAPANTIGVNVTEFDFSFAATSFTDDSSVWMNAIQSTTPLSGVNVTRFSLRKGLPYSFEISGQLGYMVQSELWSMGGGAKWALHEALSVVPVDLNVHGAVSHVVGSSQLDITTATFGATLGTQFGVMKLYNLAPYVSYQPVMIFTGSATLDATPGVYDPAGSGAGDATGSTAFVFKRREELVQRVSVGVRLLYGVLRIVPEYMWTPHQQSFNVSLGLQL